MSLEPGIYDELPAEEYHADPAPPSLSAHIAHLMISRSPLHAWAAHPQLNPNFKRVEKDHFDLGTVAHTLLLGEENRCHVVEANDWRKQDARDVRDKARANGLTPILRKHWDELEAMVSAVKPQLAAYEADPPLLCDGRPEQTLIWQEDGVTLRARADWLRDDFTVIDDLKTTSTSGHPAEWARRRLWDIGADIQAAMYLRGLRVLQGGEPDFRLIVVELDPPYAVSVVSLAPDALALANDKVEWAIAKWRECLRNDDWPAYTRQIAYAETPTWEETRWMEARFLDEHEEVHA